MLCKFCVSPVDFDFEALFGQAKVGRAETYNNIGFLGGYAAKTAAGIRRRQYLVPLMPRS